MVARSLFTLSVRRTNKLWRRGKGSYSLSSSWNWEGRNTLLSAFVHWENEDRASLFCSIWMNLSLKDCNHSFLLHPSPLPLSLPPLSLTIAGVSHTSFSLIPCTILPNTFVPATRLHCESSKGVRPTIFPFELWVIARANWNYLIPDKVPSHLVIFLPLGMNTSRSISLTGQLCFPLRAWIVTANW